MPQIIWPGAFFIWGHNKAISLSTLWRELQAEMIHKLGEEMGTKLAKAEDLGAQGNVAESLKFMEEVEDLKKKKAAAEVRALNLQYSAMINRKRQ